MTLRSLISVCLVLLAGGCGDSMGDGHKSDPTPPGVSNESVKTQQDFMNYANEQSRKAGSKSPPIKTP